MELTIRLNGDSLAELMAFAAKAVPLAFADVSGAVSSVTVPVNTTNECENEHCQCIGQFVDSHGVLWLEYRCPNGYRCYPAN